MCVFVLFVICLPPRFFSSRLLATSFQPRSVVSAFRLYFSITVPTITVLQLFQFRLVKFRLVQRSWFFVFFCLIIKELFLLTWYCAFLNYFYVLPNLIFLILPKFILSLQQTSRHFSPTLTQITRKHHLKSNEKQSLMKSSSLIIKKESDLWKEKTERQLK